MNNREKNRRLLALYYLYRQQRAKNSHKTCRPRRFWVRSIFLEKNREQFGAWHLIEEMRLTDIDKYQNYLRMSPEKFDELLCVIGPKITKFNYGRESISPSIRLALTLRYLATGDSMISMSYAFRVGATTVSSIISDTCSVIWNSLQKDLLLKPTQENWRNVANGFLEKWNFPNCLGALDGKHIVIQAPPNSGSSFYNYKGSFSIVLLAICDASYCFTMVDIGSSGRQSDGGVFRNSAIGIHFENNIFDIPQPTKLYNDGPLFNFTLVADEAFALTMYMMRPFPRRGLLNRQKKIFNYRLSRARRVIENCFGIMAARWRIFRKPIIASMETTTRIVQATVCLHNYLMRREQILPANERVYCPPNFPDNDENEGTWRNCGANDALQNMNRTGSNTYTQTAARLRQNLAEYFEGEGAVQWQWERALNNNF